MVLSGVYKIQSVINPSRIYIGSTIDIYKRWEQHLRSLKSNKHHSQKLQRHFNKYGKNDLVFSILLGCDKEDLVTSEQYFIDVYKPYFNGCHKAGSNGGFKHTDKARKKISEAWMGSKNPNYGKHFSEETRRKISESMKGRKPSWTGKKRSEETRNRIRLSKIGKPNPHKGNRPSDEGIRQIKIKLAGRIPWNKGKKNPHKGYIPSEETLRKRSESMKKYHLMRKMQLSIN